MKQEFNPSCELQSLSSAVSDEFSSTKRVLTFGEWFEMVCEQPQIHLRNAAQYMRDAVEHFGARDVRTPRGQVKRYRIFDREFDDGHRLVGQEHAQNAFLEEIAGFCRLGKIDKLLLLRGPNGSAKSTLLECLHAGLEEYSHCDGGSLYRFSWVFPNKEVAGGRIGFSPTQLREALGDSSYATLAADSLDARIGDENKDHPIYLIPLAQRRQLLDKIKVPESFVMSDTVLKRDLNARNRKIFDALLNGYQGDWQKVLQHVQVERFFLSRNYRSGLVDVEPKQTVDARSYPVTAERAFSQLPSSVGGQMLYAMSGDLVDANRGMISFSDLLKRPYEHYKYLLTATESGRIALDQVVLNLDCVFAGSANDINLLEFRAGRAAEYQSFSARLSTIPVPYLLDYRVERKIYQEQVGDLLRGVHIAPHVPRILALWGVMTRLRRPDAEKYSEKISGVISKLSPLEKADLYAYGRVPREISSNEARELLAAVPSLHRERFGYAQVKGEPEPLLGNYEGSFGASVRDLKRILMSAAASSNNQSVTVPKVYEELRKFLRDRSNHRWMLVGAKGPGYHLLEDDAGRSITALAFDRWLDLSDWEVREAMGLVDEERYLELFRKYVVHAKHHVKRERLFDPVTGVLTDPDEKFMKDLEHAMDPNADKNFRHELLARIGAWALSHPDEEPAYEQIFPDYFSRMRDDYYRQQKTTVQKGITYMLDVLREEKSGNENDLSAAEREKAKVAVARLIGETQWEGHRELHTKETLVETLVFLSKHRY